MNTKLTLRLEDSLIEKAKRYARQSGKSVSRLVEDYFALLPAIPAREQKPAPSPRLQALRGVLKGVGADKQDYYRHLEEKHR
ncbi:MAG: DUF6364 family protein [Candidatus Accumulibacter sp.]|jgi:hypothetical protein|nr:DUF6364 family protein [Accumulibacter sp.]